MVQLYFPLQYSPVPRNGIPVQPETVPVLVSETVSGSRVTRFFWGKIAQFFKKQPSIYFKAHFESPKYFETLKYLKPCFETTYLGENVINFAKKVDQNDLPFLWDTMIPNRNFPELFCMFDDNVRYQTLYPQRMCVCVLIKTEASCEIGFEVCEIFAAQSR